MHPLTYFHFDHQSSRFGSDHFYAGMKKLQKTMKHPIFALPTIALLAAFAQAAPPLAARSTFYLMPTLEGLFACEEGWQQSKLKGIEQVNDYCISKKIDTAKNVTHLLEQLEPGGPKGQVQVGFVATLQLLALYKQQGTKWEIDDKKIEAFMQLLSRVNRPAIVYLSADHFDSQGPLVEGLLQDKKNLMLLSTGKPPIANYFGYKIAPYTLLPNDDIAINFYRFSALRHVIKKLGALPKAVQDRIIAVTLPGELHHMFADFEGGTGRFEDIQVTDYSAVSVAGFQQWLSQKYGGLLKINATLGLAYSRLEDIPAPSKDLAKESTKTLAEHYGPFADGSLPIAGWLWAPQHHIQQLDLYIDGIKSGPVSHDFNRLDVYRAVPEILNPNVGYRRDIDISKLSFGQHLAQVVATVNSKPYLVGQVGFNVMQAGQKIHRQTRPTGLEGLASILDLPGVKTSFDLPKPGVNIYFNPLAREWNQYRAWQVRGFMNRVYQVALDAGLPANKIYSHQILPGVNSSWNPQLFAVDQSMSASAPWKMGINLYGGATNNAWVSKFLKENRAADYGVPEFNPQQWKQPGVHLEAMKSHYLAGARFVSPYYLSLVPDRYRGTNSNGVNAMELRPDNPKDGSDQFYRAIRQFAEY